MCANKATDSSWGQSGSAPLASSRRPLSLATEALHHQFPVGSRSKEALAAFGFCEEGPARRSQRAIKRKKFDDEIVDTAPSVGSGGSHFSAPPTPATAPPALSHTHTMFPIPSSNTSGSPSSISSRQSTGKGARFGTGGKNLRSRATSLNTAELEHGAMGVGGLKQALSKSKSSKIGTSCTLSVALAMKKKKSSRKDIAYKDLGRWKPTDDLALITAVLQTNDLHAVHRGIKFSCHFTYQEVQTRWQALMYKPVISKLALHAIKNLHPEVQLNVQSKTLLSPKEKEILSMTKSTSNPQVSDFQDLLSKNPGAFHFARTPRSLQHHWQSLKQYTLLSDQSVQPLLRDNPILNFLDAESSINTDSVGDQTLFDVHDDDTLETELIAADRRAMREIRNLEADIQKWQVLVDKVRGDNSPDFDNQTLAVLRGRLVRYLMRSKEITLGRTAKGQKVDVDLKLEGPAWKISRRQGVIKLKNSGEFFIANEGKRSLYVDGKPILRGCKTKLGNNSVLELAGLKFVFLINQELIEAVRQEASKVYQSA